MSSVPKPHLSPQQYLAIERAAAYKSEFYRGEMFAMAGANLAHNLITLNVATSLSLQLRGRPCWVFSVDMRVHIPANGLYTYPDIAALCGTPKFEDDQDDTLLNPSLIVEVLSDSTERYDRGAKFHLYQSLESLKEYVLIAQDRRSIERFARQASGEWLYVSVTEPDRSIQLDSIDCRLSVAEVYDKLVLER